MSIFPITGLPRALAEAAFQIGKIPTSALQADPRFQYAAYIPNEHYPLSADDETRLPVLVTVHGTSRTHLRYLDVWQTFANTHRCAIIAPLFPCLVAGPTDIDGYSYLGRPPVARSAKYDKVLKAAVQVPKVHAKVESEGDGIRHDLLLLALLDEVAIRWPTLDVAKIMLAGFSGGAQFVHRFMYLHPERLYAVSIGSPGTVTALNAEKPWPVGIKDIEAVFGGRVDMEELKRVSILACVGAEDTLSSKQKSRLLLKDTMSRSEEDVSKDRVQKMGESVELWKERGLDVESQIVPRAGHVMEEVHIVVETFMTKHLERWHAGLRNAM